MIVRQSSDDRHHDGENDEIICLKNHPDTKLKKPDNSFFRGDVRAATDFQQEEESQALR